MDDAAPVLPERSLDLLRVVAVTCVVADHALGLWGGTVLRVPLGTVGHLGVAIFFVHTAAVLMASLERMHEQGARDTRLALRFYLRRVLRIYPLALVAIGLVVLAAIPPTAGRLAAPPVFVPPSASSLAANLALVQNLVPGTLLLISVLWTLPIELQLYVLLPFAWMAARRSAALAWLVAGAAIVLGAIARSGMDGVLAPINAVRFAPCFAGGVLAWALARHAPARARWRAAGSVAAVGALMAAYLVIEPWSESVVKSWAFCLPLGLVIARLPNLATGAVATWAERIARHSYGIYLFHVPALWLAFQRGRPLGTVGSAAVFVVALTVVCWASYRFIEKPGIELGRRLSA